MIRVLNERSVNDGGDFCLLLLVRSMGRTTVSLFLRGTSLISGGIKYHQCCHRLSNRGSEPVWQIYQSCHYLFYSYGSHGRYYRFNRFLKLFLATFSLSVIATERCISIPFSFLDIILIYYYYNYCYYYYY